MNLLFITPKNQRAKFFSMNTAAPQTTKTLPRQDREDPSLFLNGKRNVFPVSDTKLIRTLQPERRTVKSTWWKRVSPFLLLAVFLPFLLTDILFLAPQPLLMKFLFAFLFLFAEMNVLLIDFALVNFFRGKRMMQIWVLESAAILGVLCLLEMSHIIG